MSGSLLDLMFELRCEMQHYRVIYGTVGDYLNNFLRNLCRISVVSDYKLAFLYVLGFFVSFFPVCLLSSVLCDK